MSAQIELTRKKLSWKIIEKYYDKIVNDLKLSDDEIKILNAVSDFVCYAIACSQFYMEWK